VSESARALLFASYGCGNRHYFVAGGRAPETCPREDCDAALEAVHQDSNGFRPVAPTHPDDEDGDDDTGVDSDAVRALAESVADLGLITHRQALALVLADVEDVGRHEAADRMNCSTSTLDSLLNRARSSLREATETIAMLRGLEETPDAARRRE
jgi:DNA-directed RNA polymerase specialized sigma24 family protein